MNLASLPLKSFEPRDYQLAAARSVMQKGNTLVVMPTALGKTYISILVLAAVLAKKPNSRALFLAPTKPLASQQFRKMQECLAVDGEKFCLLTGEVSPQERIALLNNAQIICATPQVIENDVLSGKVSLRNFELIVFDEVHRAVGDYSYSFIAQQAAIAVPSPLLLGLTASPSSEKEKIKEICSNLKVENVFVRGENDADVRRYVNKVQVEWQFIALPHWMNEIRDILTEVLRENVKDLKEIGFLQSADLSQLNKRDVLALRVVISQQLSKDKSAYRAFTLQAKCLSVMHALDILDAQGLDALHSFLLSIKTKDKPTKASRELAGDFRLEKVLFKCKSLLDAGESHPKFPAVLQLIGDSVKRGESVILFAHYRDTVQKLVELFRANDINCQALVGKTLKEGSGMSGMTQKKQIAVVEAFKQREFPLLVCTSVGEEGLDLTSVDLVVFFEAVSSEIRLIQRRGRAGRIKQGRVVVLVAKGTKDEAFHWISRRKERKMNEALKTLGSSGFSSNEQLKMNDF